MFPRPFAYVRAESVEHAIDTLAEHGPDASILAGGCSLIPLMKYRLSSPKVLVDIGELADELRYVRTDNRSVRIGALVRHADAQTDPATAFQPLIRQVAAVISDVQVRNMGTVVGGVCAVEPTGDWLPPLMALRGVAVVRSPSGEREIDSDELVVGPFENALGPDDLVTEVRFPAWSRGTGASHQKLTLRVNAGIVNCAVAVAVDEVGAITSAGVAFGALERHPVRAAFAEKLLAGKRPDDEVLAEAARAALADVEGFTDARGEVEFRKAAAAAVMKRAVLEAHRQATMEVDA